ncbi:hypothetical protein DUNSADRAFT_2481, partial [Dunaliella salina]
AGLDLLHFSHALESSQLEELVLNLLDPTQPALSIAAAFGQQQQQQQQQQQMQEHLHREAHKLQGSSAPQASAGEVVAKASASRSPAPLASSSLTAAAGRQRNAPSLSEVAVGRQKKSYLTLDSRCS